MCSRELSAIDRFDYSDTRMWCRSVRSYLQRFLCHTRLHPLYVGAQVRYSLAEVCQGVDDEVEETLRRLGNYKSDIADSTAIDDMVVENHSYRGLTRSTKVPTWIDPPQVFGTVGSSTSDY